MSWAAGPFHYSCPLYAMILPLRPLRQLLLLLPLLLAFGTEAAFSEFFSATQDDPALVRYELGLPVLGLGVACWYARRMEPVVRWGLWLTVAYLLALLLEGYNNGTLYNHVFSKVLVIFLMYGTYGFYQPRGVPALRLLVGLLFGVLVLNLLLEHPEAISKRAFLDQERGFSATSALLLVLPVLLCLNWFLQRGSLLALAGFFGGLVLVVFLQHRSVWIATSVALVVNVGLLGWRVPSVRFSAHRLGLLLVLPAAIGFLGGLATVLNNPDIVKKFERNFDDITKADTQGTGSWRLKQMHSYQPLIAERPLTGWRQQGFELPVQFYDPSSDQPMWPDMTGHHFHSFYLDRLFYFGWAGLLLVVVLPCVQLVRRLAHPAPLTAEAAALISLLLGGLVFGLSYDWPAYFYALLGLLLVAAAPPARGAASQPVAQPVRPPALAAEASFPA